MTPSWNLYKLIPDIKEVQHVIPVSLITHLKRLGWNEKRLGRAAFTEECEQNRILYYERDMKRLPGVYKICHGRPAILTSSNLDPLFMDHVCAHELTHYFLDTSQLCFYATSSKRSPIECRANIIAACWVIPKSVIESHSNAALWEFARYPAELCIFRRAVLRQCGF